MAGVNKTKKRLRSTALYNLPWRASVSSHQVQCNVLTFEALLKHIIIVFVASAYCDRGSRPHAFIFGIFQTWTD